MLLLCLCVSKEEIIGSFRFQRLCPRAKSFSVTRIWVEFVWTGPGGKLVGNHRC